jgi:serine/threonine protein kinase
MVQGKAYDFSVDAWSIGILAYEFLFGNAPFSSKNYDITLDKVLKVIFFFYYIVFYFF